MRRPRAILPLLLSAIGMVQMTSCDKGKKEDSVSEHKQLLQATIQSGTWRISKVTVSGQDRTEAFADFIFTFDSTGVLNAMNGENSYDGSWSLDTDDDDKSEELELEISFPVTSPMKELDEDWEVKTHSSSRIEMVDDDDDSGERDFLTLEKN